MFMSSRVPLAQPGMSSNGGEPDVLLAIGALDGAHLTEAFGHREPFAQIVVGDIPGEVALAAHRATSLPAVHETADCIEPISRIPYHASIAVIDASGECS
jgi:hypothetical protein